MENAEGNRNTFSKFILKYYSQSISACKVYLANSFLRVIIVSSNAYFSSFFFVSAQSLITKNSLGVCFPKFKYFSA